MEQPPGVVDVLPGSPRPVSDAPRIAELARTEKDASVRRQAITKLGLMGKKTGPAPVKGSDSRIDIASLIRGEGKEDEALRAIQTELESAYNDLVASLGVAPRELVAPWQ